MSKPFSDESIFSTGDLDFFDREGCQLNTIEKLFHEENNVAFHSENRTAHRVSDNALNAVLQHWFSQVEDHPNIFIDHSHVLHRFGFSGAAKEQLRKHAITYPQLWKMYPFQPKYGIDFCFDWISGDHVTEVIHMEMDVRGYESIIFQITPFIEQKDWVSISEYIIRHRDQWQVLDDYAQAAWKAKITGLDQLNLP